MTAFAPGDQTLFAGTAKGLHHLSHEAANPQWTLQAKSLEEYDISALNWDTREPELMVLGTASGNLFVSHDSGTNWEQAGSGLADRKICTITPDIAGAPGRFYLGLDGGYLFYFNVKKGTCQELVGIRAMPEAEDWYGPFGPAIFHSILPVPGQAGAI